MKRKKVIVCTALFVLFLSVWLLIPKQLFDEDHARVLYDSKGNLLAASIANDGQWRFPEQDSVPYKFEKAILLFEDEYFYYHPGVNPVSIFRAAYQNIKSGKITSGGSTITMQISRLSYKRKGKSWLAKLSEGLLAFKIELLYSKKSILRLYASHAPFGGNVVGLDAAAWRYFGKNADELTWSESATLAVLPNSPALIFPGKNSEKLRKKRDKLLQKLYEKDFIDELELQLALEEPLPDKPHALPQHAIHLLQRAIKENKNKSKINTTLNNQIQQQVEYILSKNKDSRAANGIAHAAALVLDVNTGNALAYAGNVDYFEDKNGAMVDLVSAPRSTGSILKPLLFASMLQEGKILPQSLIADVPTQIGGYVPKNYNLTYDGAVSAQRAISRSLNIPAVRMLQAFGISKFHQNLKQLGLKTINKPPMHYGLALILGGAEGRLDELCVAYANLARHLKYYEKYEFDYIQQNEKSFNYLLSESQVDNEEKNEKFEPLLSSAVIYEMLNAMIMVARPEEEASWSEFASGRKVAWKTGTSFGHRDAWSIGITSNFVVGVWIGNADGSSSSSLTGIGAAAPVMFDIFSILPKEKWFAKPVNDYIKIKVCKKSGFAASQHCGSDAIQKAVPLTDRNRAICPYHKLIFIHKATGERVNTSCAESADIKAVPYFVLPPTIEFYYKQKHADYLPLPPLRKDCNLADELKQMDIIYPRDLSEIFIPRNWQGKHGEVIFEATHRDADSRIFWSLDGQYLGQTLHFHRIGVFPTPGEHVLTLMDAEGHKLQRKIKVFIN